MPVCVCVCVCVSVCVCVCVCTCVCACMLRTKVSLQQETLFYGRVPEADNSATRSQISFIIGACTILCLNHLLINCYHSNRAGNNICAHTHTQDACHKLRSLILGLSFSFFHCLQYELQAMKNQRERLGLRKHTHSAAAARRRLITLLQLRLGPYLASALVCYDRHFASTLSSTSLHHLDYSLRWMINRQTN